MITKTAAESRPFLRFPARMADWTPQHRHQAAASGRWLRAYCRSPEGIANARLDALMKGTAPRILRLVACDVATEVLPFWQEKYPEDPRVATLIYVSRRYAEGTAPEKERLAASRLAVAVCVGIEARDGLACACTCAAEAAGFTLWGHAADALRSADAWANRARHAGHHATDPDTVQRLIAAIEARLPAF